MWRADVGHPIVPLSGLITHREKAYGVQSVISAPAKSMFFGPVGWLWATGTGDRGRHARPRGSDI